MRVVVADPPAFTPPYDHALAAALARAGADVELVTSRFRFGEVAAPDGYRRRELFYPLSSRVFGRSRLRLPLKVLEHPLGLARLAAAPADVVHLQWLAAPELDAWLLRHRAPLVLTAHDLLPRRTAAQDQASGAGCSAASSASSSTRERGRETLADFGVPEAKLRVIPHPVSRATRARRTTGATVLALGLVRPYKQIEHAREAASRVAGARLLVAGDADCVPARGGDRPRARRVDRRRLPLPRRARPERRAPAGARRRRAGGRLRRRRPRRAGARLRCRARRPAGRRRGLGDAIRELLDDRARSTEARAGALRARGELTWDALPRRRTSTLYRELAVIFRRDRFGDLIRRQLDLFVEDEAELLREAEDAERAYDAAEREDAEEAYGDYQLVLEAIADALDELRDTYAATLDGDARRRVRAGFRPRRPKALPEATAGALGGL